MSGRAHTCFADGCGKPAPYGLRRGNATISELKPAEVTAQGWPKYLHHCADHADAARDHFDDWHRGLK